jgi:hypothetical protein
MVDTIIYSSTITKGFSYFSSIIVVGDLIIISSLQVSPAYTAIKECISAKHTIGAAKQAHTSRSVAGRM